MTTFRNSLASDRIVLRRAGPQDSRALAELAELDGASRPTGDVLVAEVDGRVVAALPIGGERAIADPFEWTADLVELLRERAAQMHAVQIPRWRRPVLRRPRVAF
jgi:hypothetical protein